MSYVRNITLEQEFTSFWRSFYLTRVNANARKKRLFLMSALVFLFVSFDSFSYECLHFSNTATSPSGDYSVFNHNAPNGDLQTNENCTGQIVLSVYDYAVLKTKSESSDSFTQLFTMTQNDYELLAKSFLILLAFAVSIKLVLRQLVPK
jgi:hypothetical protein